jgi:hypothetical protein
VTPPGIDGRMARYQLFLLWFSDEQTINGINAEPGLTSALANLGHWS